MKLDPTHMHCKMGPYLQYLENGTMVVHQWLPPLTLQTTESILVSRVGRPFMQPLLQYFLSGNHVFLYFVNRLTSVGFVSGLGSHTGHHGKETFSIFSFFETELKGTGHYR